MNLLDDTQTLKPNRFNSVPRLLNRIYDSINKTINESSLRWLLSLAINNKLQQLENGHGTKNKVLDIMFNKVRLSLGGSIIEMATGSAPISAHVLQFLRAIFSCDIYEGLIEIYS